jgi:hypothetical protein
MEAAVGRLEVLAASVVATQASTVPSEAEKQKEKDEIDRIVRLYKDGVRPALPPLD